VSEIKYDVTGVDHEKSRARTGEPPKPGVYRCKIRELNPGFSKGEDGKPDRSRPRIEVIAEVIDERYQGAYLYSYLTYDENSKWKFDQFLQAMGFDTEKNEKGKFKTEKMVGKTLKIRVRAGSNQSGEYRGEVGSFLPDDGEEDTSEDEEALEDMSDENDEELLEEEEEDLVEEEEEDREAELSAMSVDDLKPIAKDLGITLSGKTKKTLIEAILEAETAAEGEEEVIEDEEVIEEDESIEEDSDYLTEDQLKAMSPEELREVAKDFDLDVKALRVKSKVIAAILEAQGAPTGDDEEMPF
jgi:hypothetical protein